MDGKDETLEPDDGKSTPTTPPTDDGNKPDETDWEAKYKEAIAQSRKWEKMARADHKSAATEKGNAADAIARAEAAEQELAAMKLEKARSEMIAAVAAEKKVDASILARMTGDKREDIEANADLLAGMPAANSYQSANVKDAGSQKTPPMTKEEILAIKNPTEKRRMMAQHLDLFN